LPLDPGTELTYLKGVGPARAAMLESKGLRTVDDLLGYVPFRYEDRSNLKPISQLAPGEMATVIAEVRSAKLASFRRKNIGLFEAEFGDASGGLLMGKWFHGQHLAGRMAPGQKIALFGKVEFDSYRGDLTMLHPEIEILSGAEEDDDATRRLGKSIRAHCGC
jgi:ATP-dependent DNA helicase RecG